MLIDAVSVASELDIRNALLQNRIDIHLALGGDFSNVADRNATADLPDISEQGIN